MGAIQNRFTNGKLVIRSDATCLQEERIGPEPDGWPILMCHGGLASEGMAQALETAGEMDSA